MTDVTIGDHGVTDTIRLAASGDEVAFARLVADHQRSMLRVAFVIVGEQSAAGDAVQAAWATAWRRLRTVREPSRVSAWLVAIAANEARQIVRKRVRRPIVDLSEAVDRSGGGDPGDAIGLLDLGRALAQLHPDDRALLAMRYVAGFDSTVIAAELGMSASGVRSRLSRLLDRLKADLDHA
jgi:RNA polymerase sigma factor (sigma-70 family)